MNNKIKETIYYTLKGDFTFKGLSASRIPYSPNFKTIEEARIWYKANKNNGKEIYLWDKFKNVKIYKAIMHEEEVERL